MDERKIGTNIGGLGIGDDHPVRIMGILNLSDESFYAGSVVGPERIGEAARLMIDAGATMLDIGGRSTAPDVVPISVEEERERVVSSLDALVRMCDTGETLVSIDTQYTAVAAAALSVMRGHGKENSFVINDVSCLSTDSRMAEWATGEGVALVIMAGYKRPGDAIGIAKTLAALERGIERLDACGFDVAHRLVIDPAIGKWVAEKTAAHDFELICELDRFRKFGLPVLVGISRKSFLATVTSDPAAGRRNSPDRRTIAERWTSPERRVHAERRCEHQKMNKPRAPEERLAGTLAATAIAVFNGAHIVRTHDVTRETLDAVAVASAARRSCTCE